MSDAKSDGGPSDSSGGLGVVAALRKYNRWRRGLEAWHEDAGPNPKDIGEQIDAAADELERLQGLAGRAADLLDALDADVGGGLPDVDSWIETAAGVLRDLTPNTGIHRPASAGPVE